MPFALTPAEAITDVIDFLSASGGKLYRAATQKLDDEPFDCSTERLHAFLDQINDRSTRYGWINTILHMHAKGANDPDPEVYLIDSFGQVSMTYVREHVLTYLFTQTREAQDDSMLYYCLKSSLSPEAMNKILTSKEKYMVADPNDPTIVKTSGVLLLKLIISESHVDTNATATTIRLHLSQLDKYMVSVNSDIEKFNQYVARNVQMLQALGQTSNDLLTNIFKGYHCVQDQGFLEWIRLKETEYEDGADYFTPAYLMNKGLNRFKTLKQKEQWMAPTPAEERIMALEAQVKETKAKDKKRRAKAKEKEQARSIPSKRSTPTTSARTPPPFLDETPDEGKEKESRPWNGKDWWYCHETTGGQCPGKWRTHKPAKCRWEEITAKHKKAKHSDAPAPRLARAYQAVIDREDNSSDSSDNSE